MLLMSNSLKVVNIALVFCASFNLLAIFIRMRFIFTLLSPWLDQQEVTSPLVLHLQMDEVVMVQVVV